MTQDEIIWQNEVIEMARQAGFLYGTMGPSHTRFVTAVGHTFTVELEAFAKLVAAKERGRMCEQCTWSKHENAACNETNRPEVLGKG